MKRYTFASFFAATALICITSSSSVYSCHREIDAIVTTDWLAANIYNGLKIIDLRSPQAYDSGHISTAINSPADGWWVLRDELLLELPEEGDLRSKIGQLGINPGTHVVLANTALNDYDRAQTNRVAWTLIYAGIANVAILDGGYTKWVTEGKVLSQEAQIPEITDYNGRFNYSVLATKSSVKRNLYYARIIDARIPQDFFGITTPREFSEKDGHISGAVNLPTPWVFTSDGLYKDRETLAAMARGVAGFPSFRKNIVYCGVGGFASTWWYLMSEVLGYPNTSLYDGSIQEWTLDPCAPVQKFMW